jgi:hypothetical protein
LPALNHKVYWEHYAARVVVSGHLSDDIHVHSGGSHWGSRVAVSKKTFAPQELDL